MKTRFFLGALGAGLALASAAHAQAPLDLTTLPVTTSTLGNTLPRGAAPWNKGYEPSAQRWVMDYFSAFTASPDGYVFGTTTWEEGIQRTGAYKEGDNCLDRPGDWTGTALAATQHFLALGEQDGKKVLVWKRVSGEAVDGQSGHKDGSLYEVAVNEKADYITGLAIDETRDKLFVSFSAQNLLKVFKLSDGTPITQFPIFDAPLPSGPESAGRLCVDGEGDVWVAQVALKPDLKKVSGTPFGNQAEPNTSIEAAFDGDENTMFVTKQKDGVIGLNLGKPQRLSRVFIKGADDWAGAKLQGGTDANGPWTDLYTVTQSPHEWPTQWITVNDPTPFRFVRFVSGGPSFSIYNFVPYTLTAPQTGRVLRFAPDGKKLGQIAVENPSSVAWDAKHSRLLVSDNDPNEQILAFKNMDAPTPDPTFGTGGKLGERGGVLAGSASERGRVAPGRFDNIRGVGVDADGTVYVGTVGPYGVDQTRIEAYSPTGKQLWKMAGLGFENHCAVNPLDETDVYSGVNRFRMDYSQRAGNEWSQVATTLDTTRYPDDPRQHNNSLTDALRLIHGHPFLITRNCVVKLPSAGEGNIAVPVAFLCPFNTTEAWPPFQPIGPGYYLWNDLNGDGQFQPNEYQKTSDYLYSGLSFDDDGNFWMIPTTVRPAVIRKVAVSAHLDEHGNPRWDLNSPANIAVPFPAPFAQGIAGQEPSGIIGSLNYDAPSRALFITGSTPEFKQTIGGRQNFGRLLVRYAVQGSALTKTHQIELPYDVDLGGGPHDIPNAISLAGEYVFVGYWNAQTVRIYRKSDLGFVGQYQVGPQSANVILDGTAGVRAFKRPKVNEYLIFHSNYVSNAQMMIRWKPDVKLAPATPFVFHVVSTAARADLSWKPVPDAAGYAFERMDHSPNGWGQWQEIGRAKSGDAASYSDASVQVGRKYAYRMRAYNIGKGGGASDYSASVFITAGQTPAPAFK